MTLQEQIGALRPRKEFCQYPNERNILEEGADLCLSDIVLRYLQQRVKELENEMDNSPNFKIRFAKVARVAELQLAIKHFTL